MLDRSFLKGFWTFRIRLKGSRRRWNVLSVIFPLVISLGTILDVRAAEEFSCPLPPPTPLNSKLVDVNSNYKLECDEGFELFGSASVVCNSDNKWTIGHCAANVAWNRPSNQSSTPGARSSSTRPTANLANDGDVSTCSGTQQELNPFWRIDLLSSHDVIGIKIWRQERENGSPVDLEIRVGSNPVAQKNPLCAWQPGSKSESMPQYHPCARAMQGRYVSIQITGEGSLHLCEVQVFATDGLPSQRCTPDETTADEIYSFNGTCFEFATKNNGQTFIGARAQCLARNGDLPSDEHLKLTSPSYHLISSTLEHLKPTLKRPLFWIGVERDPGFTTRTWRWLSSRLVVKKPNWGKDQPTNYGDQNCAALDGGKDWSWNDVACRLDNLHWICVYPPKVCGSPDREVSTTISPEPKNYKIGTEITYKCSGGGFFIDSGDETRKCLTSGLWDGKAPKCKFIDCGPDPLRHEMENGRILYPEKNSTYFGSEIKYECNDGFTLTPRTARRTCEKDGNWSGSNPKCLFSTCPPPQEIVNGTFHSTGVTHGSTIQYKCSPGHILIGSSLLTCQLGGKYDNELPTCKYIDCGSPRSIPEGIFKLTNGTTTLGSLAHLQCNDQYEYLEEFEWATCMENGKWTLLSEPDGRLPHPPVPWDAVKCSLITCDEPEVPQGSFVTGFDFTIGSEIQYHCEEGHHMRGGNEIRRCNAKGEWTGRAPQCEYVDCARVIPILNGQVTYPNSTTHLGSFVEYTCAPNYRLKSNSFTGNSSHRVCLPNGVWSGASPRCEEIRCGAPTLPPSTVITISKNDRFNTPQSIISASQQSDFQNSTFRINTVLKYRCERGYKLIGDNLRTCNESGHWVSTEEDMQDIKCIYVDCGEPNGIPYGDLRLASNATFFGTTAIYDCNKGYKLIGNARRLCLENGTWSGVEPHCREIVCDAPEKVNSSTIIDVTSFQIGGLAKHSCGKGQYLVGNGTRQCTEHGIWSGNPPSCKYVTCGPAPSSSNTRQFLVNVTTVYSAIVEYHCIPGFILPRRFSQSEAMLRCTEQGTWSPPFAPHCISVDSPEAILENETETSRSESQSNGSSPVAIILGLLFGLILICVIVGVILWFRNHRAKSSTRGSELNGVASTRTKDQPMVLFPSHSSSPSPSASAGQQHYYDNPTVDPIYENLDDYGITSNASVISSSVVTINGVTVT